jgi:hypothetical protein
VFSGTPLAGSRIRARVQTSLAPRPGPRLRAALARPLAGVLATLVVGLVCGCGSSSDGVVSQSPAEILASATNAAQHASSVHVQSRSAAGPLKLALDMRYSKDGAHGSVSLLGLDYEVIRIGDTLYVSGNGRFYRELAQTLSGHAAAAVAKLPAGTWLKSKVGNGSISRLAAITEMNSELAPILERGTAVAKGAQATVNGQRAIELKQAAKLYVGSLFIATTGEPYPILERKTGHESGQTTFTGWNQPVTLTPPTSATDLSELEQGA